MIDKIRKDIEKTKENTEDEELLEAVEAMEELFKRDPEGFAEMIEEETE